MSDDREVADAVGDAIRARAPTVSPHVGDAVVASLSMRGWRIVRAGQSTVNTSWLADVMVELNTPPRPDATLGQRAAAYDRLAAKLNRHGRGRT